MNASPPSPPPPTTTTLPFCINIIMYLFPRNDEKTALDYKVSGGSVLHLVLALRGGS